MLSRFITTFSLCVLKYIHRILNFPNPLYSKNLNFLRFLLFYFLPTTEKSVFLCFEKLTADWRSVWGIGHTIDMRFSTFICVSPNHSASPFWRDNLRLTAKPRFFTPKVEWDLEVLLSAEVLFFCAFSEDLEMWGWMGLEIWVV